MNIVIFSTQYNRYGGAATCAYELHKYFIKNNINSISIFFDNSILGDEKKYNHDKLPNVFACKLLNDYLKQDINLKIYDEIKKIVIEKTNGNFIMLGFNYLAPLIGKLLFPNNLMYYMITGTCYINNLNITNGTDLIVNKFSQEFNLIEKKTIEVSDYIIPNSNIMKNLITNIYGIIPDEIYDLHEIYEDNDQVYFNNKNDIGNFLINSNSLLQYDYIKKYDIIFISSNFDRKVKNIDLVKQIYMSEKMENLNKIVIGKNSSNYFNTNEIKNLTVYDFMNQEEIIYLIRKSKIILIPSFIESYSITCIEATNNLCIPLLSPNVGCNNFINQYYIVNDYSVEKWIEKINQINKNYIYHTKIFYNMYSHGNKILELCTKCPINFEKKKVLFITVDIPGVGGSATNTLNLINNLKDIWDIYSIFIDSNTNTIINGLENYIIINNDNNIINNLNEYKKNLTFEFNFIFCKNYKCLIYIKNVFKKSPIIFSPSGIRTISNLVNSDYILNAQLNKMNNYIEYTNPNSIVNFIRENDTKLDFLAFNYSDIIIPNSKLSWEIINKIYGDEKRINMPIYTTNIDYIKKSEQKLIDFASRPNDIIFCCYSWSRGCKNINLVKNILKRFEDKLKIIVIGKKFDLDDNFSIKTNIELIENVPNEKIKEYFKKTKTLVIPSFYDSNPNVLIEAIDMGCNIVTSRNVGNNEFLSLESIVNDYNNLDEWENKIICSLKTKLDSYCIEGKHIKSQLLKLTKNINKKIQTVGIYKINPLWDNIKNPKFTYFIFENKKDKSN